MAATAEGAEINGSYLKPMLGQIGGHRAPRPAPQNHHCPPVEEPAQTAAKSIKAGSRLAQYPSGVVPS